MRKAAEMLSAEVFVTAKKEKSKDIQKSAHVQVETNNDIITVDLGNGVKAKMKTNELEKVAIQ